MEGGDAAGLSTGSGRVLHGVGLGTNLGHCTGDMALHEEHGDAKELLWSPPSSRQPFES